MVRRVDVSVQPRTATKPCTRIRVPRPTGPRAVRCPRDPRHGAPWRRRCGTARSSPASTRSRASAFRRAEAGHGRRPAPLSCGDHSCCPDRKHNKVHPGGSERAPASANASRAAGRVFAVNGLPVRRSPGSTGTTAASSDIDGGKGGHGRKRTAPCRPPLGQLVAVGAGGAEAVMGSAGLPSRAARESRVCSKAAR